MVLRLLFVSCVFGTATGCSRGQLHEPVRTQIPSSCNAPPAAARLSPQQPPTTAEKPAIPPPRSAGPSAFPLKDLPPTIQGLRAPTVQEYRGALYVPSPPYEAVATPRMAPLEPIVQTNVQVRDALPVALTDRAASAREVQLTEALGQCLQQMKTLNTRIAKLETKAAASPPPVPTQAAPEPMPPRSPVDTTPGPIAPAGVFPRLGVRSSD